SDFLLKDTLKALSYTDLMKVNDDLGLNLDKMMEDDPGFAKDLLAKYMLGSMRDESYSISHQQLNDLVDRIGKLSNAKEISAALLDRLGYGQEQFKCTLHQSAMEVPELSHILKQIHQQAEVAYPDNK